MTTSERLHGLVDVLPEREQETAAHVLEALAERPDTVDRLALALALAPEHDEPVTDEDRAAIEQGRADSRAGRGIGMDELFRERSHERTRRPAGPDTDP